jgi:hypothetical protein
MTQITAKAQINSLSEGYAGAVNLAFGPDYQDGRNAEWAAATPSLSISMTVQPSVGDLFKLADKWTVIFIPTVDDAPAPAVEPDAAATQPVTTVAADDAASA